MMDLEDQMRMIEQQKVAPNLVKKVRKEESVDDLAEVCAEVRMTVQKECEKRDMGPHAGIAVLYLVVNEISKQ